MSTTLSGSTRSVSVLRPRLARSVVVVALVGGAAAGLALGAGTVPAAGDAELLRLLRAMAMLKLLFVAAAAAVMLWRLQSPVSPFRLSGYALACVAMAMGPGLLWSMAHVGAAAVLLHGGVAAAALLLWRDPAISALIERAIARRRSLHRA